MSSFDIKWSSALYGGLELSSHYGSVLLALCYLPSFSQGVGWEGVFGGECWQPIIG